VSGVTLDAGPLIGLDKNNRKVIALLARAGELGVKVTVPSTALAQAIRHPARQVRLTRLVRQAATELVALDGSDATHVGILLARTGTRDIVDAHVVVCAKRRGQAILTSDSDDLRKLDPEVELVEI